MLPEFEGQVVLVAGGTGALGRAVTKAFLDRGAHVHVTLRHGSELESLRQYTGHETVRLQEHYVDVTSEVEVREMVGRIHSAGHRIDAMVNAVGGYAGGTKMWELDPGELDRMLALNLRSGYTLVRAVVPVMLAQGHGSIVNVAAKAALDHVAGAAAYVASKAAAVAMMDSLAAELVGTGVRVNSVLPSIIDSDANRRAMPSSDFAKWPKPEEIARIILLLCSDDTAIIHGASIPVYGAR